MSILNIFRKRPVTFFTIVDQLTTKVLKLKVGQTTTFKIPNGFRPNGIIETVKNEIPENIFGVFDFSVDRISHIVTVKRLMTESQSIKAAVRAGAVKLSDIPQSDSETFNMTSSNVLEDIDTI